MMLHGNLRKRIAGAVTCVAILFMVSPSVFAAEPHEDPEIARLEFGGVSLFRYYSASLDFVLRKEPAEVEARLEKIPFANIPQSLEGATDNFAASSIGISHLVVEIAEDLDRLRVLGGQFRLGEAVEQAAPTFARLSQAYRELNHLEQATEITGEELKVSSAPAGSDLRRSYDEVLERIDRIREMLALHEELLESTGLNLEELLESTGLNLEELLKSTGLNLEIRPIVAFVGDNIRFEGVLTSEKRPLAGREVDILINGSRYVTSKTDAYGHYQGRLQVPYWYMPELDLQALYYPRGKDVGLYLASLSPVRKLKVLFYEAELGVTVEDKAYPGLETTITGRFDYGQSPSLNERKAEIYFDDVFITEVVAQEAFVQEIVIDPDADVGEHVITVSAAARERYAPVVASAILNVARATPILDLGIPRVALIPGSIGLGGKLYSEVGPLSEALIKMGLGKSQVELLSSEDGAFDTRIGVGMGLGVIGSQDLVIQVLPQEPWHFPLVITRTVVLVNVVNCGGILAILIFFGIYLPGRLGGRLGVYPRRRVIPVEVIARPQIVPTYSDSTIVPSLTEGEGQGRGEPRNRIFYRYRLVVRLVQRITRALLAPHQTLREFAYEGSRVLGPAAKYFIELTEMVERLLYSQYSPTEGDVGKSKQLSGDIEKEPKSEVTMQSLLPRQLRGEGTVAQFEPNELSVVGGARAFELGGRVSTTSTWRQLSTWLWVLLILAVAYYACILLFVLPLLLASLAYCLPLVIVDDSNERGIKAMTKEELKGEGV
ncbi:DUF4129 domain-containing protein [Chloroflexota bacterium]